MNLDFNGLISLLFVTLIVIIIAKKKTSIASILYVALGLRLLVIVFFQNILILPDSYGDTTVFENRAYEWSQGGFYNALNNFPGVNSRFLSWLMALLYSLFGRSEIMAQSISLLFAMGSIFMAIIIAEKIWDKNSAKKVGWILAFFPTIVLYSTLFTREPYSWFFLLTALYGIVRWSQDRRLSSLLITLIGFTGATFFHGGLLLGGLIFLIFIMFVNIKELLKAAIILKISFISIFLFIFILSVVIFLTNYVDSIPKLHSFKEMLDVNLILKEISYRNIKSAAYPEWTIPTDGIDLIFKAPIRIVYFIFSPFPWDINKLSHIIGFLDSICYILLFILLTKNFKKIINDPTLKIIFLILACYLIVFGIVSGNFGTAIRHRAKFFIFLILLVAPWIPKLTLKKIKKKLS